MNFIFLRCIVIAFFDICFPFKANLRQFLSLVRYADLDKISKLLDKGVDPNFQGRDDGGECVRLFLLWSSMFIS